MLSGKKIKSNFSMWVRANLSSWREVWNYLHRKAMTCFICHPHNVPAGFFSNSQDKIWG
jgi:hypothetical protein